MPPPEAQNPYDPTAVVVWVFGGKVGYLSRELAIRWQPIVVRLRARYGFHVACRATLDPPSAANQGGFGMIVWLPDLPAPQPVPSQRAPVSVQPPVSAPVPASHPAAQMVAAPAPPPLSPEQLVQLREEIAKARADLMVAQRELSSVEEAIEVQSFSFYKPRYGFESSAQYTARLKGTRDEQQTFIKEDKAAPCDTKWTVGGSAAGSEELGESNIRRVGDDEETLPGTKEIRSRVEESPPRDRARGRSRQLRCHCSQF